MVETLFTKESNPRPNAMTDSIRARLLVLRMSYVIYLRLLLIKYRPSQLYSIFSQALIFGLENTVTFVQLRNVVGFLAFKLTMLWQYFFVKCLNNNINFFV